MEFEGGVNAVIGLGGDKGGEYNRASFNGTLLGSGQ